MAFDIPSIQTVIKRVRNDLNATGDVLRRTDNEVLARSQAGTSAGLSTYLQWVYKQMFYDTCDDDVLIARYQNRLTVPRQDAVSATGKIKVTGQISSVIDVGTLFQSTDGRRYAVTAAVTLTTTTADASVQAVDVGQIGNIDEDVELTAVSPILGVSDTAAVISPGIAGGTEQESIDSLRLRIGQTYKKIPHGGDDDDYVTWAKEVAGVTRAWCVPSYLGPGTVGVFFVRDGDSDPFPDNDQIESVYTHIDTVKPVTADLYVSAPTKIEVNFKIKLTPDSTANRASVTSALQDLILSEATLSGSILLTHISQTISNATGEDDHVLYEPTENVSPGVNGLLTFGSIQWV